MQQHKLKRMKTKIDIETWPRKEHFLLFKEFEEPYYGVNISIDCTAAYRDAKASCASFFLYYLHKSLAAAQQVDAFRLRIENDEVFLYDVINGGSTVDRPDGTFGFAFYDYAANFGDFMETGLKEMTRVRGRNDLERTSRQDLIRFSALPWIDFTSVSHARSFAFKDSAPKISFGKMTEKNGVRTIPMSIHVHHALVDGLHIGQFIDIFQKLMNEPVTGKAIHFSKDI